MSRGIYSPGASVSTNYTHKCDCCGADDGRKTLFWKKRDFDLCLDCLEILYREHKNPDRRIITLANFFYSSDDAKDVPLRISCITGRYSGFDLSKEAFIELFTLLSRSRNLKRDLMRFRKLHA